MSTPKPEIEAKCTNSVPKPDATNLGDMRQRVVCGWRGVVPAVKGYPCPRCAKLTLAPVVRVRRDGE